VGLVIWAAGFRLAAGLFSTQVKAAVRYGIAHLNKADAEAPLGALDTEPDDVLGDMLDGDL